VRALGAGMQLGLPGPGRATVCLFRVSRERLCMVRVGGAGVWWWLCCLCSVCGVRPRALAAPVFAPVMGSPFGTDAHPQSVAFSPNGDLLATANNTSRTVSVFAVGGHGALTPVAGSPFRTESGPASVAFSPNGDLLATANIAANTVSLFAVGAGGALTPVAGSPFLEPAAPRTRWRSVPVAGCSRSPTDPTTRCRCSRSEHRRR
jgi:DNA-binding beta-propeller fold protein YncE